MSTDERLKRPNLERTAPIRRWPTLFSVPTGDDGTNGHDRGERDGAAAQEDGPRLGDAVQRAVELGYRVFDDQIRKGQEAAAKLGKREYGPQAMQRDFQDLAMRWVQYASDLTSVWMEMVQVVVGGTLEARRTAPGEPPAAKTAAPDELGRTGTGAATTPAPPRNVRVRVRSIRPTEVALELRPEAQPPFEILAPRAPSGEVLPAPQLVPGEDGRLTLDVSVPDDAAPGNYFAVVVRTNEAGAAVAAGTFALTVDER